MVHIKKKRWTPGSALILQLLGFGKGSIGFSSPSESFESLAFVVPCISEIWI